jgi:hypothetical protein
MAKRNVKKLKFFDYKQRETVLFREAPIRDSSTVYGWERELQTK